VAWNLAYVSVFHVLKPKPVIAVGARWKKLVPLIAEGVATDSTCVL